MDGYDASTQPTRRKKINQNKSTNTCKRCYVCDMPDLNIRNVSKDAMRTLKVKAAESELTLREYCLGKMGVASDEVDAILVEDRVRSMGGGSLVVERHVTSEGVNLAPSVSRVKTAGSIPAPRSKIEKVKTPEVEKAVGCPTCGVPKGMIHQKWCKEKR